VSVENEDSEVVSAAKEVGREEENGVSAAGV
jgi:hypothetical protein